MQICLEIQYSILPRSMLYNVLSILHIKLESVTDSLGSLSPLLVKLFLAYQHGLMFAM
jgi:hypothetical protein